jgi:deoxyribodipyrimidine photo-lyase
MEVKFNKSIFIFRRDLRIVDNTALVEATEKSNVVLPCFIFDLQQIAKNEYFSPKAFRFMLESLLELKEEISKKGGKLSFYQGKPEDIVKKIIEKEKPKALFANKDYTPFSTSRDEKIEKICKNHGIRFYSYHDILLSPPEKNLKHDGTPYTIFTAYYKNAKKNPVKKPLSLETSNYSNHKMEGSDDNILFELLSKYPANKFLQGGRKAGLEKLKNAKKLVDYDKVRDFPEISGTSGLSPHLKFGTISIREVYWGIRDSLTQFHPLIRQLYWRDFFTNIAFYYPHVFGAPFKNKYKRIIWDNNGKKFEAWKKGLTGFPIVDAGMRELNETGIMHNRVRMITASFLVKDLHIDWRLGEKYFAQKLADYDPCINNGNWQWVASTGCDAQPYFRIFNPWLQQKKFDPNCTYIKKWVPELKNLDPKTIHSLWLDFPKDLNYPKPIVFHDKEAKKSKENYFSAMKNQETF